MSAISLFIYELRQAAKELEEKYLTNKVERDENGKLNFIQYKEPLDENAEPEHITEIDDSIKRALKLGWDPNNRQDHICRYSYFLWNYTESSYLHRRASELQKEI